MRTVLAITRPVPDSLAACELTYVERTPIDLTRARRQHAAYEAALRTLGCEVRRLPPAHEHPDSVFVEDTAVVLDEVALITRPGAASRRGEGTAAAALLGEYRPLHHLADPGTLDGGDVLRLGRILYVGIGGRTNEAGLEQLARFVRPYGYDVRGVSAGGCLHLKSAVTEAADGTVLVNPAWIDPAAFSGHKAIEVDPAEPSAANVLRVRGTVLAGAACPRTRGRLEGAGLTVRTVDVSELAKAEGALTCCSLLVFS